MKTTLKTLICTALCCVAGSAFAGAPNVTSGNKTWTVGVADSYQIVANQSPTGYNAAPLPAGLGVNTLTGVISGTPTTCGSTDVTLSATNGSGTGTKVVQFIVNPASAVSTAISFNNNPATPDGTTATDVTITSTTTYCPATVDQGRVELQVATNGLGVLVPAGPGVTWVALDNIPDKTPSSGVVNFNIDLDNFSSYSTTTLPNVTCPTYDLASIGFRTHYKVCSGGPSVCSEPGVPNHFSPGMSLDISCNNPCPAVQAAPTIEAILAAGNGSPLPGYQGCWTYRITVMNCTGNTLTGVKIQGGSNGWTDNTLTSADFSGGTPTDTGTVNTKKNTIIHWIGDIADGETVTIDVEVCGKVPGKIPGACGNVLNVNGAWSVKDANGNLLAAYTAPVTITVTCP